MTGSVYLLPVTLGGTNFSLMIPSKVLEITLRLRYFAVEDIRSARRYLRALDSNFPIDDTTFYELSEHTTIEDVDKYLLQVRTGFDLGIMSEAGLPGIADPGAALTRAAHLNNIKVIPLSGPSSILLALIASGMNGQNFAFHGYLPVKSYELQKKLIEIERRSQSGETQIFMETPYRNQRMFDSIISTCKPGSLLCIAADISLPSEEIHTTTISEWRRNPPALKNRPAIFLLGR